MPDQLSKGGRQIISREEALSVGGRQIISREEAFDDQLIPAAQDPAQAQLAQIQKDYLTFHL